jgi:SnoaL-like domain
VDGSTIDPASVQELLGRWWFNYDEGNFGVLAGILAPDVHFSCRTDTGTTEYEDFVRADLHGRDAVMRWQQIHRTDSPYPLRHNGTNVHIVERGGAEASFASYILVTQIVDGQVSNLSTAIVNGSVRTVDGGLQLTRLEVVLDTQSSAAFGEVRTLRA